MTQVLADKLEEWEREQRRLLRETRILLVEEEPTTRQQVEDLLYPYRISIRSVGTADQAMDLLQTRNYPMMMVSDSLAGLGGLYLLRQVRATYPDVDAIIASSEPTVEVVTRAFDLRVLDVLAKPFTPPEVLAGRVLAALKASVQRRMRGAVLKQLRDQLGSLPEELRTSTTTVLERRLSTFKSALGSFNRVLVVEPEEAESMRALGEQLLLAGLHVETVREFDEALRRVRIGDIHLLALPATDDVGALPELIGQVHAASPLVEPLLCTSEPSLALALAALRLGVGGFVAWPPASGAALVARVEDVLKRSRRERLMDNLLAELFRETERALGTPRPEESFATLRRLVGLQRLPPTGGAKPLPSRTGAAEVVEFLDEVLDTLLSPEEAELLLEEALPEAPAAEGSGADRRQHPRVPESHFVRFQAKGAPASTLALLGDLSEGGVFVRSGELLLPGTFVEVDFTVEDGEQPYLVRCRGQVAWVARDNRQSPLGPGFGVKLVEAPAEVVELLKRVVARRITPR